MSLVNFDQRFNTLARQPTIINDLPAFTNSDMELLHKTIYVRHTPDLLTNVPSCECGALTMEYRLGAYCSKCGTTVTHSLTEELDTLTWIRAPHGVHGLINPCVWTLLSKRFSIGTFNLIQYLTDPYYKLTDSQSSKILPLLEQLPFEKRGLNYFIDNFDEIMNVLFSIRIFAPPKSKSRHNRDFLRELCKKYRQAIFAQKLPIPHRSLLVIEDASAGNVYLDEYTPKAINAVLTLAGIDTSSASGEVRNNLRLRESRAVRAVQRLAEYYSYIVSKRLAKKEGIFRKQVFATRSNFSFRAVVSSITEPHWHEQILIPWGVAVGVLEMHLNNKLCKLGFTPNEIKVFLNTYANKYHPLLDHLFKELIREASNPLGICATLNRPPSLKRGSIQRVFIPRVKRPEEGNTVSMSILIVRPLNADKCCPPNQ